MSTGKSVLAEIHQMLQCADVVVVFGDCDRVLAHMVRRNSRWGVRNFRAVRGGSTADVFWSPRIEDALRHVALQQGREVVRLDLHERGFMIGRAEWRDVLSVIGDAECMERVPPTNRSGG